MQGTTEAMSYNAIFSPLIRRSELYCCPVLLLGSISSGPRSLMHYTFGLKPKHGSVPPCLHLQLERRASSTVQGAAPEHP